MPRVQLLLAGLAVASGLDVKVAPGLIQRGYGQVRISVVDEGPESYDNFFSWNSPFMYRWTNLWLHTTVKSVSPGTATVFNVGGTQLAVRLPAQGAGTRGFFIADPCISSRDLLCPFLNTFQTFPRLVDIINTLVGSEQIDYWGIIGDNFYEKGSPIGQMLFEKLSVEAKSKLFLTVPGNHDFWIAGGPPGLGSDQMGNGFMQYYGQDVMAGFASSANQTVPKSKSSDPACSANPGCVGLIGDCCPVPGGEYLACCGKGPSPPPPPPPPPQVPPYSFVANPDALQIADLSNFVFTTQIGNVAFFGFSGAHPEAELAPYIAQFCEWMGNAPTVNSAVVLGHWNTDNLGCQKGMSAPEVHDQMKKMDGCSSKLVMYVDGHTHCNENVLPGEGFMIGANGMGGCSQFGFMEMETDGAEARVDYFEVARLLPGGGMADNFAPLMDCLSTSGYLGCRDQWAAKWRAGAERSSNSTEHLVFA